VRAQLDVVGVAVLAAVVGLAGGITCDLLIGVAPAAFRDWIYLVVAAAAGVVAFFAHARLERAEREIQVLDAAGLALFCVTGATTALNDDVAAVPALVGAVVVTVAHELGATGPTFAIAGAAACFALRLAGIRYDLRAPTASR
jgi:uncharacterized membrane protein YeiH